MIRFIGLRKISRIAKKGKPYSLCVISLLLVGCTGQEARFSYTQVSADAYNSKAIQLYEFLLEKYTHRSQTQNRIRYENWANNSEDLEKLDLFIEAIAKADLSTLSLEEELCLYLNAYNAIALQRVLTHYDEIRDSTGERTIRAIRDRNGLLLGDRIGNYYHWTVAGVKGRTLNFIRDQLIRNQFTEPRIHFALNRGIIGDPPVPIEAFTPDRLDDQLNQLMFHFVSSASNSTVNLYIDESYIVTSPTLHRFADDFRPQYGFETPIKRFLVQAFLDIPAQTLSQRYPSLSREEISSFLAQIEEEEIQPNRDQNQNEFIDFALNEAQEDRNS